MINLQIIECVVFLFFALFLGVHNQQFTTPVSSLKNTYPVEHFIINLDLPPAQRWDEILTQSKYKNAAREVFKVLLDQLPELLQDMIWDAANAIGDEIEKYIDEPYASELKGVAANLELGVGEIVMMNLFYDLTALCTSIVAEADNGTIYHARNLDFGNAAMFTFLLQNLTIQVEFQQGGKTIFYGSTYAGYIGILTGMKPDVFAVSVNERIDTYIFANLLKALENLLGFGDAISLAFLLRDQLMVAQSFEEVKQNLTSQVLIADVYLALSGTKPGEGVVITRNRDDAADIWNLNVTQQFFLLQTNDDHWLPPMDSRRDVGNKAMKEMGRDRLSFDGLLQVLSTRPVLNSMTTYSTFMSAQTHHYETFKRTCPECGGIRA